MWVDVRGVVRVCGVGARLGNGDVRVWGAECESVTSIGPVTMNIPVSPCRLPYRRQSFGLRSVAATEHPNHTHQPTFRFFAACSSVVFWSAMG